MLNVCFIIQLVKMSEEMNRQMAKYFEVDVPSPQKKEEDSAEHKQHAIIMHRQAETQEQDLAHHGQKEEQQTYAPQAQDQQIQEHHGKRRKKVARQAKQLPHQHHHHPHEKQKPTKQPSNPTDFDASESPTALKAQKNEQLQSTKKIQRYDEEIKHEEQAKITQLNKNQNILSRAHFLQKTEDTPHIQHIAHQQVKQKPQHHELHKKHHRNDQLSRSQNIIAENVCRNEMIQSTKLEIDHTTELHLSTHSNDIEYARLKGDSKDNNDTLLASKEEQPPRANDPNPQEYARANMHISSVRQKPVEEQDSVKQWICGCQIM